MLFLLNDLLLLKPEEENIEYLHGNIYLYSYTYLFLEIKNYFIR